MKPLNILALNETETNLTRYTFHEFTCEIFFWKVNYEFQNYLTCNEIHFWTTPFYGIACCHTKVLPSTRPGFFSGCDQIVAVCHLQVHECCQQKPSQCACTAGTSMVTLSRLTRTTAGNAASTGSSSSASSWMASTTTRHPKLCRHFHRSSRLNRTAVRSYK